MSAVELHVCRRTASVEAVVSWSKARFILGGRSIQWRFGIRRAAGGERRPMKAV